MVFVKIYMTTKSFNVVSWRHIFCKKSLLFYYGNNDRNYPEYKYINDKQHKSSDAIDIEIKKIRKQNSFKNWKRM